MQERLNEKMTRQKRNVTAFYFQKQTEIEEGRKNTQKNVVVVVKRCKIVKKEMKEIY